MPIANSEPPHHYVDRIRAYSVYPKGRKLLHLLFWLAVVALLLISGSLSIMGVVAALKTQNAAAILPALGALLLVGVYIMGLLLLRSLAEAAFDAADVLVDAHRRKKEDAQLAR